MVARRLGLPVLVVVCALFGLFGLGVGSAGAFQTHAFEGSFGPDGASGTHFQLPASVAVDESSGDLYVGQVFFSSNVEKFNVAHAPEPFTEVLGGTLTGFGGLLSQLAVASSSHNVYFDAGGRLRAYGSGGKPVNFTAGPGAGTNEIEAPEICGVAVDSSGDIYVSEWSTGVRVFSSTGEPVAKILVGQMCNLAVDSHGVVYATNAPNPSNSEVSGPVLRFAPSNEPPVTSSTTYELPVTVDGTPSFAVAVDPVTDHLLVDEGSRVAEYDETGVRLGSFGGGAPGGLPGAGNSGVGVAVNAVSGQVFVAQGNYEGQVEVFGPAVTVPDVTTEAASGIDPKGTATLNGTVKPDGIALTQCQFEYVEATHYEPSAADPYAAGGTVQCESPAAGEIATVGETQVHAGISGLTPGVSYDYRLMASNKTLSDNSPPNYGSNSELSLPPLPVIEDATATNVARFSAELSARINPGSLITTYHFEYDTAPYAPGEPEGKHGTSVGAGKLSANAGNVVIGPVRVPIEENHTYYWRIVATNDAGTTIGIDHTFVYDTSGETLPDNRAYEMVTPAQKNGAVIGPVFLGLLPDIAEGGSRVTLSSIQCFADAGSCEAKRGLTGTAYFFSRTSAGWVAHTLAPSANQFEVSSGWMVSAEQESELFSMPVAPMFQDDFFVRKGEGPFVDIGAGTPPADGPVGLPWEAASRRATSDFSHVIIQENQGFWSLDGSPGPSTLELPHRAGGAPVLVGVSGGAGSHDLISHCGTWLGLTSNGDNPGELSGDGEVVFFTAVACKTGTGVNENIEVPANTLYARIGGARTVKISGRSPDGCLTVACRTSVPADALFAGASNDGSKVFFTSNQQLMDSAATSGNLYEYDFGNPAGGNLVDVSAGDTSGGGPNAQGVVAISADGSHVYFVAGGVLSTGANQEGEKARAGANDLYVFSRDAGGQGHVTFIAQLPGSDSSQWSGNDNGGEANVTPDGRFLVFESHGLLTRDDTRSDGAAQIFRYDAQTGELVRLSVGEKGFNDNGNAGVGDAQIVPAKRGLIHAGVSRSDPTMSHDGSFVFFESPVGLTRHALNDVRLPTVVQPGGQVDVHYATNIYEWHEGHVYLISDGRDTHTSGSTGASVVSLSGSDGSGANVFFGTGDALVAQDTDTQMDYYDARVCTTGSPCISSLAPPLPPCLGEACHGTPAAQVGPPNAGTVAFNGQGNVSEPSVKTVKAKKGKRKRAVRCSRGRRRVRGRCVKMKVRRGRAGRAGANRGGK